MRVRLAIAALVGSMLLAGPAYAKKRKRDDAIEKSVAKGLAWLVKQQRRQGYWEANQGQYRIAMTALCGMSLLGEGSTTTRGKYAKNIQRAVTYLIESADPKTGLIGYENDYRYTYGHGFSMLFLSQVYGEEEDAQRRAKLRTVLKNAVKFSRNAQTTKGGWGYVSAKDGKDFDEGSTCITQVQGLRACRNAGIPVPSDVIKRAKKYIADCTVKTGAQAGGVLYSLTHRGGARAPITAAAVACLFNTGEYGGEHVKTMMKYCENHVWPRQTVSQRGSWSHWHYAHYYYSQVVYRLGDEKWNKYVADVHKTIVRQQSADGSWKAGDQHHVGPVYITALNTTILQMDKGYLPIYQR